MVVALNQMLDALSRDLAAAIQRLASRAATPPHGVTEAMRQAVISNGDSLAGLQK